MSLTFLMPCRIESEDRLRNVISSVGYLAKHFPHCEIIIKEVDKKSVFEEHVVRNLTSIFGEYPKNITHIFEQSEDPVFFREKILNEMLMMSKTKVVVNYDCDVVFPVEVYEESYIRIMSGKSDVVYPYGQGNWQYKVAATDELVSEFLNEDFNLDILKSKSSPPEPSDYGWVQFFNRDVYIEGGMENENFIGSAPDDFERHFRFSTLGYKVDRIKNYIYHLEHSRGMNSWPNSYSQHPHTKNNMALWERLKTFNKEQLEEYYSNQSYLQKYSK